MDGDPVKHKKSGTSRYVICQGFLDAYQQVSTISNCIAGFRASRIFPFDPEIPLLSQYETDAKGGESRLTRHKNINSMLLTGEDGLGVIEMLQFGRHITSEKCAEMKLEDIPASLRNASVADMRQISPFLSLFQVIKNPIWREAFI
jgi:hypothetical protein